MKSHAIIPIFIPHKGCPNDCVFCNQKKITSTDKPIGPQEVTGIIEKNLFTLQGRGISIIEVAFYGGSFTAIPKEEQSEYLEIASFYKRHGMINKIHLSTRPDKIDDDILSHLKSYNVDIIELGAQSFDDEVLRLANRGHDSKAIISASQLVQQYGFELGLQLMIGLPGDTMQKCVYSAKELVKIGPSIARLYPTIVLPDTRLYDMLLAGEYKALTLGQAVSITTEMYKIITAAGINIIRVGLKGLNSAENSHPAFRQLVEAEIAKEALETQLLHAPELEDYCSEMEKHSEKVAFLPCVPVAFKSNEKSFSSMIGNARMNRNYFREKYPLFKISYEIDNTLADYQYLVVK